MYCNQCGKQIPDQSAFCNYCGNKILTASTNEVHNHQNERLNDQLLYSYKPTFHSGYMVKKLIPLFLFFSFFFSILVTIVRGILLIDNDPFSSGYDHPFRVGNIFWGLFLSFIVCIVVGYPVMKKRYENANFLFYQDRMEYIDGYFNFNKKQIYYKNILEISMSQNVFQRNYGIGSIVLTTSGDF